MSITKDERTYPSSLLDELQSLFSTEQTVRHADDAVVDDPALTIRPFPEKQLLEICVVHRPYGQGDPKSPGEDSLYVTVTISPNENGESFCESSSDVRQNVEAFISCIRLSAEFMEKIHEVCANKTQTNMVYIHFGTFVEFMGIPVEFYQDVMEALISLRDQTPTLSD